MNQIEAEAAFKQAIDFQQQGQLEKAQDLYEQILVVHRNHHHALHLLGVIVSQKGNQFYARRLIESSLTLAPGDPDALANLGQVFFYLGLYDQALARCDQSIALQASNARCHLTRGKALRFLARYEEAVPSFDQALRLQPSMAEAFIHRGFCLHNLQRLEEALADYSEALRLRSDNPEVLNNRGHALFALERQAEAVESIERALQLSPDFPEAYYHRGLTFQHEKRLDEALACYGRAVQLKPDYEQALVRLAFVMHKLKKPPQDCIAILDRALRVTPDAAATLATRAGLLAGLKILDQALQDYDRSIALAPDIAKTHADRGETLLMLKRPEDAAQAFRQALALGGDPAELSYALASLGADATPATAPAPYVVSLFDWYADHFDNHLQGRLKYQTPALICEQIFKLTPPSNLEVLDLGCGTGLCGPLLKPLARTLTGVDLSPNMLEMARKRDLYDELVCSDLTAFLALHQARFDLVIATDVFIYVGALEAVFQSTRAAVQSGSLFAFSFETSETQDLVLRPTRRYAHSVAYIQRLAATHGFTVLSLTPSVIREEGGQDLDGFLAVLRAS
ncbi:tetratricopeptide repeat protein [Polaromonas sp. UC242_47]|uniref:tetratricopeptide repeat protein n=1 Tax=Polaromonas sp. UC242_47 TaxID=3374626 RepID=UPI003795BCB7